MQAEDYYQLLGAHRQASRETLRQAFRTGMLNLHPDLHPDDLLAPERTRQLVEAYKTLSDPKARRDYDRSLARPEIPAVDWVYIDSMEATPWARQALMLLVAAMIVVVMVWAARTALADRTPVYRFQMTEIWSEAQPRRMALLVEPVITDGVEWYATTEYQLRNSSSLVARQTASAYERAVQGAESRGDHAAARFYRSSLEEIRRAQTLGLPLGPVANPVKNPPTSGAKPSAGSS